MSAYRIEAGTAQHIGAREEQQDRVAILTAPKAPRYIMAVLADGMGGLSGGAIAAEQVINSAKQAFELFSPTHDDVTSLIDSICQDAHTIIKLSSLSAEKNPHSTVVILVLTPEGRAHWAHVGDSRLYHFEGPNFISRTQDHSYVELLIKQEKLTPQQAAHHPMANILVSALGDHDAEPDITHAQYGPLKAGDAFLLCTDGLWHYFTHAELGAAVAMNTPRMAAELLIEKARERAAGTNADNCSFAILKLTSASLRH